MNWLSIPTQKELYPKNIAAIQGLESILNLVGKSCICFPNDAEFSISHKLKKLS